MKKNREVRVHVSKEELEKIKKKAEAVGMTASGYLRYLGLNTSVKVIVEV